MSAPSPVTSPHTPSTSGSPNPVLSPASASSSPSSAISTPSSPLVRKKRNFKSLGLPSSASPANNAQSPMSGTITPSHTHPPTPPLLSLPHPPPPLTTTGPKVGGSRRRPPPLLDVSKSKVLPPPSLSSSSSSPPPPSSAPHSTSHRSLQSTLTEQLATLDLGDEGLGGGEEGGEREKVELRAEDLRWVCELGQGNGGSVSKVVHVPTGRTMAKKLVLIDAKPAVRKQILRELQIMHDCRSPRIISFFGAFVADPHICICMEFSDKGSLDQIYKRIGPIDIDVVAQIALAVLEGLTYLYDAHRIIHRDIKPSNILFNSAGQIKLCDFGVSGELINSIANTFVGTSTYMSPERIQGAPYTVKSDVWSLGITLIELALGRFPFADDEDGENGNANGNGGLDDVEEEEGGGNESETSFGEGTLSPRKAPAPPPPVISVSDVEHTTVPGSARPPPSATSASAATKKNRRKSRGVSLQGSRMTMSILELLQHIVNEPAPTLPRTGSGRYPDEAREFVGMCLEKAPEGRPTPRELLGQRWVREAGERGFDLVAWAETI